MRFFVAGKGDERYLEGLIKTGDAAARKCKLQIDGGDMDQHEVELAINPTATRRCQVVKSGLQKGVWLDLYGARARIFKREEPGSRLELVFDGPVPARFLRKARQPADRVLQLA